MSRRSVLWRRKLGRAVPKGLSPTQEEAWSPSQCGGDKLALEATFPTRDVCAAGLMHRKALSPRDGEIKLLSPKRYKNPPVITRPMRSSKRKRILNSL